MEYQGKRYIAAASDVGMQYRASDMSLNYSSLKAKWSNLHTFNDVLAMHISERSYCKN
jgi:hypothetical protein